MLGSISIAHSPPLNSIHDWWSNSINSAWDLSLQLLHPHFWYLEFRPSPSLTPSSNTLWQFSVCPSSLSWHDHPIHYSKTQLWSPHTLIWHCPLSTESHTVSLVLFTPLSTCLYANTMFSKYRITFTCGSLSGNTFLSSLCEKLTHGSPSQLQDLLYEASPAPPASVPCLSSFL